MRELDGSCPCSSGRINPYGEAYRPQVVARKARAAVPEDARPIHVRMRAAKDAGATWDEVAGRFGLGSANTARAMLLRLEREAAAEGLTPRQRVSKVGLGS